MNWEKLAGLGGAVTAVFGVLSSFNPYLAYADNYFGSRGNLTPFPVSEFQPLPFTIGLLLSSFGGILGLVAAVKWRERKRPVLPLGSFLGCAGLLVFMLEFLSKNLGPWWIVEKYMIGFWPETVIIPGVGFYFVLFGSLLMFTRVAIGRNLRRIAVGALATSLILLVFFLCMFFSPALDSALPSYYITGGLLPLLGGLSAVIVAVISLFLILRSKKVGVNISC